MSSDCSLFNFPIVSAQTTTSAVVLSLYTRTAGLQFVPAAQMRLTLSGNLALITGRRNGGSTPSLFQLLR